MASWTSQWMMMDVYAAQKAAVAASDANGYAIPPLAFNRFFC